MQSNPKSPEYWMNILDRGATEENLTGFLPSDTELIFVQTANFGVVRRGNTCP